jgi:hypothetical protein
MSVHEPNSSLKISRVCKLSGENPGHVERDCDEDLETAFGQSRSSFGSGNLENGREFGKTLFRD